MKVEVAVLGSPSLIVFVVSVDVKQHLEKKKLADRAQEVCERRGGRPGLPVPNSPCGFCGRKATLNKKSRRHLSTADECTPTRVKQMDHSVIAPPAPYEFPQCVLANRASEVPQCLLSLSLRISVPSILLWGRLNHWGPGSPHCVSDQCPAGYAAIGRPTHH